VAKTRRSVKKRSAKAAKKTSKRAAPRTPRRAAVSKPPTRVELKKLRKQFGMVLTVLAGKVGDSPDTTAKLDDTRRRISQWMTDIDDICSSELQEICGPDMAIPLPE
jgi:hypothetical protein